MNVKPYTPYSKLTSGIAQRNASDVVQNVGRGLAMGIVNAVLSPKNLVHKIRGQESKIRWLSIRSNHETRVSMRAKRGQLITQAASEESHDTVSLALVMQSLQNMGFGEYQRLDRLQEFDADDPHWFIHVEDPSIMEPEYCNGIRINGQGQRLLAEYYARKYGANIVFPEDEHGSHLTMADFHAYVRTCIEPLQKEGGDVRCAFYLGGNHTVPVIYIKEKGQQSILVADSKGGGDQDLARVIAQALAGEDITVYRVDEPRQRDMDSCYADAVKFSVTMTGREPLGGGTFGEYLLPSIGDELKARTKESRYSGDVSAVTLPSELIKLAQISAFVRTHSADTPEAVLRGDAKHRTLEEFQFDYQATFTQSTYNHPDPKPLPKADYLRQKGFRYAEIIQIEYYNKQLKSLFGETHWNVTRQEEFAHVLKQSLRVPRDKQTSDESSNGKLPSDDTV
jgi:hypothetical protein